MRRLAIVLALAACDHSPFGTTEAPPGEAILGKLEPENGGSSACIPWASPSKQLTGLGNGHHFLIANKANSTLLAFDQQEAGQAWVQTGSPKALPGAPFDVTATADNCPYVALQGAGGVVPVPFDSGDCSTDAPNFRVGPAFIAFDSVGTLYAARPDNKLLFIMPPGGAEQTIDLPVTPERITIHQNEIWVAYQPDANSWDILSFDKSTRNLLGHIGFPWPSGEDLAGMVWNDVSDNLVAHANDRDSLICAYNFIPQL